MTENAVATADSAISPDRFISTTIAAAIEQHIAKSHLATEIETTLPAHLSVLGSGRAVAGTARIGRKILFLLAADLRDEFVVRIFIFFVTGIHLHGDLKLFFALVRPFFLIEHDGLQVMPLGVSLVEVVQFLLCARKVSLFDTFLDLAVIPRGRSR